MLLREEETSMTHNYLFSSIDDYELIKRHLDLDLGMSGAYKHVIIGASADELEGMTKMLSNAGYFCVLSRTPDMHRKAFPNNVVDLNIHLDSPLKAAKEVKILLD